MDSEKNYVTSYINPDMDGAACSIALARLLSQPGERAYVPVVFGNISDETSFVLRHLGIDAPSAVCCLANARSVALVDTHHRVQLPDSFPFDKVELIIDHHTNGDDPLFPNAAITNRRIGAAASIVADMYFSKGIVDQKMLPLLGFAILSNTLNFSAPSTSDFDTQVFSRIEGLFPFDEKVISEMFLRRASVLKSGLTAALLSDFKVFETKRATVGIAQLEAYELMSQIDVEEVRRSLSQIATEKGIQYCMFNGVDIKVKKSIVVCANDDTAKLASEALKTAFLGCCATFDRILLRKTDFVPLLNV